MLNTEEYLLTHPTLKKFNWLCKDQKVPAASQAELNETVTPLYGLDPKGVRDWNEEYQIVKDFPKEGIT